MMKLKGIDFWDQKTFDSNLTKGQLIFKQTNQYTVESKHTQRDRCDSPHLHLSVHVFISSYCHNQHSTFVINKYKLFGLIILNYFLC